MRFPPPIRITAPVLALVFGLVATWFDYRLNLDLDLARHLEEERERADVNGQRLARLSERLLASGQPDALKADVEGMAELPLLEIAVVVDQNGIIFSDSSGSLSGKPVSATPSLARLMSLLQADRSPVARYGEDTSALFTAHPFRIGENGTGWALLKFDRRPAIEAAEADARVQLRWMASAMGVLGFALWAILHYGFASRLGRLSENVKKYGEGESRALEVIRGGDEVAELSGAFAGMATKLNEREAERVRLENEVLEISERERRRIGNDLHDDLGQRLTAASMATNALVAALKSDAPDFAGRGEEIGRQLRDAIAEARSLSHGLAPVAYADEGLMSALSELAADTSRGGALRCVFECPQPVQVKDAEVAGHLYRIAQEAVVNVIKHANASEIRIGLECRDGVMLLEVEDDGDGIDEAAPSSGGIGLRVMRHRAQLIGGALEIGSAPAGGGRIACKARIST